MLGRRGLGNRAVWHGNLEYFVCLDGWRKSGEWMSMPDQALESQSDHSVHVGTSIERI